MTIVLGAVAYDPKVVTIWEGFRDYFAERGLGFDYVLFSNYERQVEAHMAGTVNVAWNSPLAWVRTRRLAQAAGREARAIAMRDTDQDLTSVIVVRRDADFESLEGRRIATGASDSPQATLIPLAHLGARDLEVQRFEVAPGKHGDHVGGERDAVKALLRGEVDAACMIDGNLLAFSREGTIPADAVRVFSRTPLYDHCAFTVLDDFPSERFVEELLAMSYDDPAVRPLLDLEGLKAWRAGRTTGFAQLEAAVDRFGFYTAEGAIP
jgi:ABC-type phosphate/phosphonate transport system substrate-binding protein